MELSKTSLWNSPSRPSVEKVSVRSSVSLQPVNSLICCLSSPPTSRISMRIDSASQPQSLNSCKKLRGSMRRPSNRKTRKPSKKLQSRDKRRERNLSLQSSHSHNLLLWLTWKRTLKNFYLPDCFSNSSNNWNQWSHLSQHQPLQQRCQSLIITSWT